LGNESTCDARPPQGIYDPLSDQGGDAGEWVQKWRCPATLGAWQKNQALDWLQAALNVRRQLFEKEPEKSHLLVARDLYRWLGSPDCTAVRDPDALARLPDPERQAWQRRW